VREVIEQGGSIEVARDGELADGLLPRGQDVGVVRADELGEPRRLAPGLGARRTDLSRRGRLSFLLIRRAMSA
jgi:hypothetical protein